MFIVIVLLTIQTKKNRRNHFIIDEFQIILTNIQKIYTVALKTSTFLKSVKNGTLTMVTLTLTLRITYTLYLRYLNIPSLYRSY